MGKYRFKYIYDTGDSFNNDYGVEAYFELEHENLAMAEENLQRIGSHYQLYKKLNNLSWSSKVTAVELLTQHQDEPWFVKEEKLCIYYTEGGKRKYHAIDPGQVARYKGKDEYEVGTFVDQFMAEHYILLLTDAGKPVRMNCPWCGYFETLQSIEIEEDNSHHKLIF